MRSFFFLFVFALLLASCKKEETPAPATPTGPTGPTGPAVLADYSKLAIGNWWAYQTMRYDTSGNYWNEGTGRDTLRITRDTIINSTTYFVVDGTSFGHNMTIQEFWRDSANCIVNEAGSILFCFDVFDQVLQHDSVPGYYTCDHIVSSTPVSVSTPAGTYSCYVMHFYFDRFFWPDTETKYSYARGIGRVHIRDDFPAQPGGLEQKLMGYHVQ